MIDVGMRQDHGVHIAGLEREVQVPLVGVSPPALIEAAVEQQLVAVDL